MPEGEASLLCATVLSHAQWAWTLAVGRSVCAYWDDGGDGERDNRRRGVYAIKSVSLNQV